MAAVALANARQLAGDLSEVDTILVRQEVEHFEVMSGIETENSYVVLGAPRSAKFRMLAIEQSACSRARLRQPPALHDEARGCAARGARRVRARGVRLDGHDPRRGAAPLVLERPLRLVRQEVSCATARASGSAACGRSAASSRATHGARRDTSRSC